MCLTNIHHIAILITAVKVAKCNLNFVQEGQGRTILFNATQRIQVESLSQRPYHRLYYCYKFLFLVYYGVK